MHVLSLLVGLMAAVHQEAGLLARPLRRANPNTITIFAESISRAQQGARTYLMSGVLCCLDNGQHANMLITNDAIFLDTCRVRHVNGCGHVGNRLNSASKRCKAVYQQHGIPSCFWHQRQQVPTHRP